MPLWASYLVKIYTWRTMLGGNGFRGLAAGAHRPRVARVSTRWSARWIVLTYLWLPYMILPILAGLERIPSRSSRRRPTWAARQGSTFRRVVIPLVIPAIAAGSIFTFSLTLGDYIAPDFIANTKFIGNVIYDNSSLGNLPLAAAYSMLPVLIMIGYLLIVRAPAAPSSRCERAAMTESRLTRTLLRIATGVVLVFVYTPLVIIAIYAFNPTVSQTWPPSGFTLQWFGDAFSNPHVLAAFGSSVVAGGVRHGHRAGARDPRGAGRPALLVLRPQSVSLLLLLPIALPGVVTGIALSATFQTLGITFGLPTVIVGHATFCVVIAYNNVLARLRRLPRSPEEASADLGAASRRRSAGSRCPPCGPRCWRAALLAFALSFDEVIVTNFTAGPGPRRSRCSILRSIQRPTRAAGRERRGVRPRPAAA